MTLRLGLRVLKPKTPLFPSASEIRRSADERLADFAGEMIDRMAFYPPQLPSLGARSSLGRRFGNRAKKRTVTGMYRRTGKLGRSWRISARRRGFVEVSNAVDYAVYVQGPPDGPRGRRQTAAMRARHWRNITTEARRVWAKHRPGITSIFSEPRGRGYYSRRLR